MARLALDYFSDHLVLAALLVSGLWFYGGYQDIMNGKRITGLSWQFIGVAVLAAFCVNTVVSRSWYGLMAALAAIAVELLLIRRYWREKSGKHG